MDANQPLPEEALSLDTTHYSEMGSAHPADNSEDSEVRIREEIPNSKRPRYPEPPMRTASGTASSREYGFNTTFSRGGGARGGRTWLKSRDTPLKTQATPASNPRVSEAPWCQRCRVNHFGNCLPGRSCFNCGGMGHLRRNCPTIRGNQGPSRGSGRPIVRENPSRGQASNSMPPSNAPRPVATHSSVQQPRVQGRTFALYHRKAMASNAVVKGMISVSGHIAHTLFDFRVTHLFVSSAFAYKLNQELKP